MSLKAQLPTFEKGSADLGGQLRQLLAVVVEACEAIERIEASLVSSAGLPADETEENEAPVEPEEVPEAVKPASKPATRAAAK